MANAALIIAETGSGKSTSIRTLDPKTTFINNITNKPLPFKGWKGLYKPFNSKEKAGNYTSYSDAKIISNLMDGVNKELTHIKTLVIEDFNYMSGFELMNRSNEKGYDKFNDIAKNIFTIISKVKDLRDDLTVFFTNHPETSENIDGVNKIKAKSAGRMIDNQIVIEGLFTVVLYGRAKRTGKDIRYVFETQTDGVTPAKSPMGMFDTFEIPNDLELVRTSMISYNE